MEKSKITYAQAIAEVEQILERFNNEQMNVDELGAQVKRAAELIRLCKERLRKAEKEVDEAPERGRNSPMKQLIRFVLRHVPRRYIQRVVHLCTPLVGYFTPGSRVQCPVCGNRYRKFMPYGYVNSRENALCPHCLALERHRLMWLYLQNETDFFEAPARVLHIAPEYCFLEAVRSAAAVGLRDRRSGVAVGEG